MVVFVLATAAAYLLCILLKPEPVSQWLDDNAHTLKLVLLTALLVALLVMLFAAIEGPRGFSVFLFSLATFFLTLGIGSLLYASTKKSNLSSSLIDWLQEHKHLVVPLAFLIHVGIFALPIYFADRLLAIFSAIYIWAIVIGGLYILITQSANPAVKWLRRQPWSTGLVLFACFVMALVTTLIAWETDAWAYTILLTIRRIASMPEAAQALLGMVAGIMFCNFSRWIEWVRNNFPQDEPKKVPASASSLAGTIGNAGGPPRDEATVMAGSNRWLLIVFAGALSIVLLAALAASYAPTALNRVSGLETPYLKVQFAISPAEKQLVLNVERDLYNFDKLEEFPRSLRFIQYDCAQAAVDAQLVMAKFTEDQRYKVFTKGLAFRGRLLSYINRIVNAQRKGYNLAILRERVKLVAEKFALLATNKNFEKNYKDAISEVMMQEQLFGDDNVPADIPPEEANRQDKDPDPKYCLPTPEEKADAKDGNNADDIKMVVGSRPQLVHGFATSLFFFNGNTDAAIAMLTSINAVNPQTQDVNAIGGLANALYLGGRDFREVLPAEERELKIIESRIGQIGRAKVSPPAETKDDPSRNKELDKKIYDDLAVRYERARFRIRLRLAYLWAQHDLGSPEDVLPQRDLHWSSAQTYADDAYESLRDKSKSAPRFDCTDDALDLAIKDTYAYVKLAFQAYNLKTQRTPPVQVQVSEARWVLEQAMAEAREAHRRLEEARSSMATGGAAPSCLTEAETRAWVKRIASHLKLAEALQP